MEFEQALDMAEKTTATVVAVATLRGAHEGQILSIFEMILASAILLLIDPAKDDLFIDNMAKHMKEKLAIMRAGDESEDSTKH